MIEPSAHDFVLTPRARLTRQLIGLERRMDEMRGALRILESEHARLRAHLIAFKDIHASHHTPPGAA
jgi:hypothetical protein